MFIDKSKKMSKAERVRWEKEVQAKIALFHRIRKTPFSYHKASIEMVQAPKEKTRLSKRS